MKRIYTQKSKLGTVVLTEGALFGQTEENVVKEQHHGSASKACIDVPGCAVSLPLVCNEFDKRGIIMRDTLTAKPTFVERFS